MSAGSRDGQRLAGGGHRAGIEPVEGSPDANLAVVSRDDNHAPVLASWQAGLGRVLCYTGEADGKYTGPIAGWKGTGDFFASLARWTAGKSQGLGKGVVATQATILSLLSLWSS